MTELGVPLPSVRVNSAEKDNDDDDTVYEIERVLRAEKIKNRYRLWIKWKGFNDPTPMWRSHLAQQTCNAELLKEIDDALDRCRTELNGADADEEEDVDYAEQDEQALTSEKSSLQHRAVDFATDRSVSIVSPHLALHEYFLEQIQLSETLLQY